MRSQCAATSCRQGGHPWPVRMRYVATNCRSGFIRDAPRGRRSICVTLQGSRHAPRITPRTESARSEAVLRLTGACLDSCRASGIERRPRGASRMNPLLRFVATCHCLAGLCCQPWYMSGDKWGAQFARRRISFGVPVATLNLGSFMDD